MKDMEYISMERSVELANTHISLIATPDDWQCLCNAAIADYLKGVGGGVALPKLSANLYKYARESYEDYARQAIAPYAARLAQAEAVLRMAKDALIYLKPSALTSFYTIGDRDKAIAAINQQLGEK